MCVCVCVCVCDLAGATRLSEPPEKWLGQTGTLSGCHDTQPVTSGYSQGRHTVGTAKRGATRPSQTHRESAWHHFPLKRHILPLLLAAEMGREWEREGWGCFRTSGRLAVRPYWWADIFYQWMRFKHIFPMPSLRYYSWPNRCLFSGFRIRKWHGTNRYSLCPITAIITLIDSLSICKREAEWN